MFTNRSYETRQKPRNLAENGDLPNPIYYKKNYFFTKERSPWGQNRKTETDENYLKFSSDYIKIII